MNGWMFGCVNTGRFIMFSVITDIYKKKTKGPTLTLNLLTTTIVAPPSNASKWQMGSNSASKGLMELFTAAEKIKKFFFQLEMFDVCSTGDTAHIDTIFKLLPHTHQHVDVCVARTRISY
jgi:hypothetical protein